MTNLITYDEIENTLFDNPKYISIELMEDNTEPKVLITGHNTYNDEVVKEIQKNSDIFCDKNEFIKLLEEANHPYVNK